MEVDTTQHGRADRKVGHVLKPFAVAVITLVGCQQTHHQPESASIGPQTPPTPVERPVVAPLPSEFIADALVAQAAAEAAASPPKPIVSPPDLWRELRRDMHLPRHLDQARVQQELRWFKRNPDYLQRLAPRLQNYLPYIYRETQLRSLPAELALVPIVESALDTFAFSPGGAAGPWQFMRGTAKQYGIQINDWYDGRRDIVASTDAALAYLHDLHGRFDSWNLALAGYNAGQGNVGKARRRNPQGDFFALELPRETEAYVPRILALAEIIAEPDRYGITLPEIDPEQRFATLDTHSQFQLDKLSETIGLDLADLYSWNPAFNQWATPPKGPHRIVVPIDAASTTAQAAIDAVPKRKRLDWLEIRVKQGDTLSQIAARHRTDVATIKSANKLASSRIRAGHKLLIPTGKEAPKPGMGKNVGSKKYVVRSGDSLWTIARAQGVSMQRLMRANHVGPRDTLRVGQSLIIPGASNNQRRVTRKVRYKVRKGDSLARIANKFNVSIKEITSWNDLDRNRYLQPGQGLLLYVNVTGG